MSESHLLETRPPWDVFNSLCPTREGAGPCRRQMVGPDRSVPLRWNAAVHSDPASSGRGLAEGFDQHPAGPGTGRNCDPPDLCHRSSPRRVFLNGPGKISCWSGNRHLQLGRKQHGSGSGGAGPLRSNARGCRARLKALRKPREQCPHVSPGMSTLVRFLVSNR